MAAYQLQASFARGELSPRLQGRHDIDHYAMSLATCYNWYVLKQGGIRRRPGTFYAGTIKDQTKLVRLIPFQFNASQSYVVEMGEYYFRFWIGGGQVVSGGGPYEVAHPYTEDELSTVQFLQSADVIYFAHQNHPPAKLQRFGETAWVYTVEDFEDGPFLVENDTATYVTPAAQGQLIDEGTPVYSATAGTAANAFDNSVSTKTLTGAGALPHFIQVDLGASNTGIVDKYTLAAPTDDATQMCTSWDIQGSSDGSTWITVDRRDGETGWSEGERRFYECTNKAAFRYWRIQYYAIDTGSTAGVAEWKPNMAGDDQTAFNLVFNSIEGVNDDQGWSSDDAGTQLRLYGDDGKWRYFKIDAVVDEYTVTGRLYGFALPNLNRILRWRQSAWSPTRGYPSTVGFYEGRLAWGATPNQPRNLWLSRSQDYDSMVISQPVVDDDSVQIAMSGEQLNQIVWIKEAYELAVATTGSMHAVGKGDTGKAFSPNNVNQRQHVNIGSKQTVRPVQVGSTIVMVDQFGRRLHEFAYSFEINGYRAPELSIMSDHIIRKGVTAMAYAQDPDSIIWMITSDGQIASCTYEKDQQIVGMARHGLAPGGGDNIAWGRCKDLCVIATATQNEVWCIAERVINGGTKRYMEYFGQPLEPTDEGDDLKTDTTYFDSALMYSGASTTILTGLGHLEGETVGVLGNGTDLGDAVVSSGQITVPGGVSVTTATVGLRYMSDAKTLEPPTVGNRDGSHMGRIARVEEVIVNYMDSGGIEISTDGENWEEVNPRTMDEALETEYSLQTGKHRLNWTDDTWDDEKNVWIRSNKGYPATIRAMVMGIEGEP